MRLVKWDQLPDNMRNESVKDYYLYLQKKRVSLFFKRMFDILASMIMIVLLSPIFIILSIWIKIDSKGPVLFRQTRITQYGKTFCVCKFRTMVNNAEAFGSQVTKENDIRITKVGSKLRHVRLDELPQLFNVFAGTMSFVGTRPEVPKYVNQYTDEMMATLLLPAGVTSKTSICYKDEDLILAGEDDIDKAYINKVLPEKMKINCNEIMSFSFWRDIKIMLMTVKAVL